MAQIIKCPVCEHNANYNACNGKAYCGFCGKEWNHGDPRPPAHRQPLAYIQLKYKNLEIMITIHLKSSDFVSKMKEIQDVFLQHDFRFYELYNISFAEEEIHEEF
jgi:hypothetical protein